MSKFQRLVQVGRRAILSAGLFGLGALSPAAPINATENEQTALAAQKHHVDRSQARGAVVHYTNKFDLSGLPAYQPSQTVSGTIRLWGLNYLTDSLLAKYWEDGFRKFHPQAKFVYNTPTALVAIPGLYLGLADIGASRKITFDDLLAFQRIFNYQPLEITIVTGSYDVPGWAPALGIFVHKDNPLSKLTVPQLDGIFGAERDGAYVGLTWHPEFARGPEGNIRTWGQLGLTGEWADKPITIYGRALKLHQQRRIEEVAFHGGDKWTDKLHESYREMVDELSGDRYGIAFGDMSQATPQTKILSLARDPAGPFVDLTIENLQNRRYPLYGQEYFYINRTPGQPADPKVLEYIHYVLSREGQEAVQRDGKYLPLTAEVVREQQAKLDTP